MTSALGLFDWIIVVLLALVAGALASAFAVRLSRWHTDREIEQLLNQIRLLKHKITSLEQRRAEPLAFPSPALPVHRQSSPVPDAADWVDPPAPPPIAERSVETLTQDAAAALASLDAFRRFAERVGGTGYVLASAPQNAQPTPGNDPVSGSDLWAVQFGDTTLHFLGYNLRRTQSALLADAGRLARDRLGWVFDVEAGEKMSALRPAIQPLDGQLARGLLILPF